MTMSDLKACQRKLEGCQACQLTGNGCGKARQSTPIERLLDNLFYGVDSRASLSQVLTGFVGPTL